MTQACDSPIACGVMTRTWILPVLLVLCGSVFAAGRVLSGSPGEAAALLLGFVLLAGVTSPLVFPRSIGALEAQRRSAVDGHPIVYWRPGCTYCLRLRVRLGPSARRLHWVDIWRDPEGAAVVRAANDGNETVPTVVVAGRPHTNPEPGWVREQLRPSA
ncbi:membrane protein [Streptomyces minutiscleroticus]|uniref:Membrane protein n=2 Tax=Streptomyces minutiscleroticus TaxID=68238 RepID=A0A918NVM1_9ACTN|nr:membrane protein [Streptomyces minutiscleroticus]